MSWSRSEIRLASGCALAVLLVGAALPLAAQDRAPGNGTVAIETPAPGETMRIDIASLQKFPATEERVSFMTERGPHSALFKGASLWSVLVEAHAVNSAKSRDDVGKVVIATGKDGFTAAVAVGEIAPAFEAKPVLLAYEADGHPLAAPRLVVPGDKHGGRSVRDLVRIAVR